MDIFWHQNYRKYRQLIAKLQESLGNMHCELDLHMIKKGQLRLWTIDVAGVWLALTLRQLYHAWLEINGILDPWVQDHQDVPADPTLFSYRPRSFSKTGR